MKITWFGGACFRLYLGGLIFVTRSGQWPSGVSAREIQAGADHIVDLENAGLPVFRAEQWIPHHTVRLIDDLPDNPARIYTFGGAGLLIDDRDEPPLILATAAKSEWGRFADDAVVILCGKDPVAESVRLFAAARPKLVTLVNSGFEDTQINEIAGHSGRTSVQILEPGLALEA